MSCYTIENAGKTTMKTDDYAFAIAWFVEAIKEAIGYDEGAFGPCGLPFSLEAYLAVDDELQADPERSKIADAILGLFDPLMKGRPFRPEELGKAQTKDIDFETEDWRFSLERKGEEILVEGTDGTFYLRTNVFSLAQYQGDRYFDFKLQSVIQDHSTKLRLGEIFEGNIILKTAQR